MPCMPIFGLTAPPVGHSVDIIVFLTVFFWRKLLNLHSELFTVNRKLDGKECLIIQKCILANLAIMNGGQLPEYIFIK